MDADATVAERYADLTHAEAEFAQGRADAYQALYAHSDEVSIFGGLGGYEQGWEHVGPRLAWAAAQFQPQHSAWTPTPVAGAFGLDFGYLVWHQTGTALTKTGSTAMQRLRVTHVYRRTDDGWKIVHRHADPLLDTTVPR